MKSYKGKRINLSETHSLCKKELGLIKSTYDLVSKETGEVEATGTYTRCFRLAKEFKEEVKKDYEK